MELVQGEDVCPVYEKGLLTEKQGTSIVKQGNNHEQLFYLYSICDACQSEIANARQVKWNEEQYKQLLKGFW